MKPAPPVTTACIGLRIHELTMPEFEHHQLPEAVTVIRAAAPVLRPQPADFTVVEETSISQA